MIKYRLAGVLVLCALMFTSCRSSSESGSGSPSSALDRITRSSVMRVGYVKFFPCADIDPATGKLSGIFVDAIQEIATDLKLRVEFKETTLATFSAALQANEFDFSIGPTFITPSRSVNVRFTHPLLALGNSGLVLRQNSPAYTDIGALARPNVRVAVLQGQAMEQFVRSRFPSANLIVIAGSDLTAPLSAVQAGQADIGLSNSVTVQQFAQNHPETAAVYTDRNALSRLALAWVVRSDDQRLEAFLNSSIEWLVQSGKLATIQERYPVKLSELN